MNQLRLLNLEVSRDLSDGGAVLQSIVDGAPGLSRWIVVIPRYWPEAANQMGERAFWRVQAQKRQAVKLIAEYGHVDGKLPKFAGQVTLRMIRLWAKRCRAKDTSNLHASTKFVEDALKCSRGREKRRRLGVITDDSPRYMTPEWEQWSSQNGRGYCIIVVTGRLATEQLSLGGAA